MTKVILAEDHKLIRNGLKMLLESTNEFQVVLETENGQEVICAIEDGVRAELLITDIDMPGMDGLSLVKILSEKKTDLLIIILSMLEDEHYIYQAFKAGASAFVSKSASADELFFAIKQVMAHERYLGSSLSMKIIDRTLHSQNSELYDNRALDLSSREIEILQLIAEGLTNAEMAETLFISKRTVEGHRQNLLDKTQVKNTAALMRFAFARGIIQ